MHHRSLRLALAITTGLCSTVLLATPAIAQSLPTGPSVGFQSGGTAIVYGTSGTTGTLNLGDNQRSIVNWSSFGVGTGSAMQFQYGGAGQGAVLNRVVGATSSSIAGSITGPSNLDIFLINPNGIIVGAGANINVGGLVASTLDLTDADFANGSAYNFSGTGTTGVTVNGGATLNSAGSLVLLGGFVSTSGALSAGRDVVVAAASDISLATAPGSPLSMTVNQGTPLSAGVTLAGTVNGANIYAATASRAGVANNILNVSGALTAATATATDRGIVLAAGTSDSGVTVASGGGNDTSGSARLAVGGTATAVAGASAPASSAGIRAGALGLLSGAGSLDAAGAVTVYSATNSVSLTGVNAITARGDVNAVASNGSINIRKATTSSGDVDFQALGIQLTNATIGSSNGSVELLTGDVTVSGNNVLGSGAGGVTVWGAVNGVGSLTINSPGLTRLVGNVGQATALTSLTTDAAGATELAGAVRTTGAQTYNDAVYVSGSNLLQSTAAGNITFGGTIDGGSALTVNTAGATSFNGTIGGTTSLTSVTTDAAGTTSIGAGSIRTTGAQAFGDNVVLASNAVLTGATFSAASVSGSGNDLALNFSGPTAINGATMLGIRNLSSGGGGTTLLSGTVQTTGSQSYSDAISLGGNTVLASSAGGAVAFNGTVDGAYGLTVNTSGATSFNGNVGASTALTSLTTNTGGSTTIAGGSIRTAGAQSYGDSVILSNGTHTLNASSVAFGGPVNAASYGVPTLSIMTSGATSFANTIFGLGALGVSASTVSFTGTNNRVGTLAANVTAGGFSFGTDDSLTIGAVNGLSGITTAAGQNIRIETPSSTSTRTLTVAGPVKASGGGDVTILYWGGSLQGTGLISGDHLLVATNEGVGTRATPIKTAVNSMSVFGGNQGAFIDETDSVTLLDSTIPACNGTCTGTINNGGASYDLTAGGTITVGGFTWAGGDISLTTSSGDISFTPAGQVNTSGDIRLTAADNLNGGGGPLAARNIYLAADDWTNGIFGAATLQESQDLSITDTASGLSVSALTGVSAARNLSISTIGADLTVGGISAGGNINLSSSGDLALTDTIAAVGDTLSLSAGRSISQTGTNGLQAGTLTGTSGGSTNLRLHANQIANLSSFTANEFVLFDSGGLIVTGPVHGGSGVAGISTSGDLVVNSGMTGFNVSLLASGAGSDINLNAAATASNVVELITTGTGGISQTASGAITAAYFTATAGGAVNLAAAANQVSVLGYGSGNGFALADTGGVSIEGTVDAGSGNATIRTSGGDLTIASSGALRGADVTVATDGGFNNASGADAVTASNRWLVYSANPASNSFGGLNSNNNAVWNAAPGSFDPSSVSGNRYVFAYQPTLTVTTRDASKVYGTDLTGSTGSLYSISGLHAGVAGAFLGDTAASVFSGAPLISSAGLDARASVAGGPYAVTGSVGSLALLNGYALAFDNSGAITVTPKALNAAVTANDKTYDGTTAASGTVSLAGVVSGDSVNAAALLAFADKNAGSNKTVTITGGSLSGTDAGNYTLTLPASTLATIFQKAISGTVTANDKTYDGTTAASGTVSLAGVVSGDSVNAAALLAFADKNAGSNKTVTITGGSLSGTDAGNYTLTLPASTLADILQRGLVVAANNQSKVAGTPDPALTYSLVSGNLVAGDSLTGILNRAPGESPGPYGINQGSLTAGQNYAITYHAGELTIAAAPAEPQLAFGVESLRATPLPAHIKRPARSGSLITIQPGIFCSPQNPCPTK